MEDSTQNGWPTIHFEDGKFTAREEEIATEFPLTVMINGEEFATIVCSPTDLRGMVIGFLAAEGAIRNFSEIKLMSIDEDKGFAHVELYKPLAKVAEMHSKRFIGSCCGKSRQFYFKTDVQTARTIMTRTQIKPDACIRLMKEMQQASDDFQRTGGIHNAALATVDKLLTVKTDIGRHNTLDKIYGQILEERISVKDKVVIFSGRISSEVLLKVSKMGIGLIISKSAPTDLALELANDLGITTIGFTRGNKMNIYTHPERVIGAAPPPE
ncbi:formate dehydrogenase accessory sulfurtransferase FdhD [Aciduricibacillus chroicocephali]|uniref:Sulfur carrier protein FdhD n=1 Tax=Aciduricibacillus chroicocephali TaxID=3054939 RepID=A0ABY9KUG8_9BACI|nr:formate dehydrogenase accessory sulfurtransferase FdhD [Bacillaceae bacterium 44XB]